MTSVTDLYGSYENDKLKLAELNRSRFAQFQQLRQQDAARRDTDDISEELFDFDEDETTEENMPATHQNNDNPSPTSEAVSREVNNSDVVTTADSTLASTITVRRNRSSVQNVTPSTTHVEASTTPTPDISAETASERRLSTAPLAPPPVATHPIPPITSTTDTQVTVEVATPAVDEESGAPDERGNDSRTEDTIDSSASLFSPHNNNVSDELSTQDNENVRNLAENFGVTPLRQNEDSQTNFKFRKRPPLK